MGHQIVMTGKCCEIEGKGLYKVGDIIDISEPNSCTRKTVKCGEQCISTHLPGLHSLSRADPSRQAAGDDQGGAGPVLRHPGRPPQPGHQAGQARQVRLAGVQVRHKRGQDNLVMVIMVCRLANTTQGELVAGFELVSEMEGCNCCLVEPDIMIGDGERHRDARGHDLLCYKSSLVRLSNDKVDHRLEVT